MNFKELQDKIKEQGYVAFEDIEHISFITNFAKLGNILSFVERLAIELNLNYDNLKMLLNSNNINSEDELKNILKDTLKDVFNNLNQLPALLQTLFMKKDSVFPNELAELLSSVTKIDANYIFESHFEVQLELLLRSVFSYRNTVKKNLFTTKAFNLAVNIMQTVSPSLIGTIKEKLNIKKE